MVDGLRILLRWIDPCLDHFKNKEAELVDQTSIGHLAFEIGETLGHERRCHELGWHRRQAEPLELGYIAPRAVAHLHNLGRKLQRRNGDHALLRCPQRCKRVIAVADDAGNQRWFELDHHVPRQISVLRRFARNSPSQKTGPCSRHSIYKLRFRSRNPGQ